MCYDSKYSVTDLQRCPVKVQKSNHHFYNKTEFKNPRPRRIPPTKIITSVTSRVIAFRNFKFSTLFGQGLEIYNTSFAMKVF